MKWDDVSNVDTSAVHFFSPLDVYCTLYLHACATGMYYTIYILMQQIWMSNNALPVCGLQVIKKCSRYAEWHALCLHFPICVCTCVWVGARMTVLLWECVPCSLNEILLASPPSKETFLSINYNSLVRGSQRTQELNYGRVLFVAVICPDCCLFSCSEMTLIKIDCTLLLSGWRKNKSSLLTACFSAMHLPQTTTIIIPREQYSHCTYILCMLFPTLCCHYNSFLYCERHFLLCVSRSPSNLNSCTHSSGFSKPNCIFTVCAFEYDHSHDYFHSMKQVALFHLSQLTTGIVLC